MKTVLIAVPTDKYVEPETFKSIYDLNVPNGYEVHFQIATGTQVDQIRNLIADWATRFDYLFAVDADMSFAPDTLERLLSHDKDVVSGLYIQRKPGQHILEIYRNGRNVPYSDIKGKGLVEIDGCGFGCVLVKSEVIRAIGYPQFVYKSALDHAYTVSEDTYFCSKATQLGFKVWADTTIKCGHHGASVFYVDDSIAATIPVAQDPIAHLKDIADKRMLPVPHRQYLEKLGADGVNPSVVYDLGSCVLHWAREAATVWPAASVFAIEAMAEVEPIYNMIGLPPSNYHFGVLSDTDGKEITFYKNVNNPAGNSCYKENAEINKDADALFTSEQATKAITMSLDTVMEQRNWPLPDLIKMDIQGAEMDVLKGASKALSHCDNLILELQHVEYNKGAPLQDEVIEYLKTIGFELVGMFCDNGPDGDFHFRKVK